MPQQQEGGWVLVSEYAEDPEMAALIGTFVGELPARVEAMRRAWEGCRYSELARLAHQLKGSSGGYGFAPIGRAGERLEAALLRRDETGAPRDPAAAARRLEELAELCSRASAGKSAREGAGGRASRAA